eukprot:TRINITY_DN76716_c0_g1_i1.p1 TRINITY_DN76716_c0_g1~~TRINITY_DN76716_c0_g1_i1.p1  ORF type:complete len:419 (-),score=63.28 TRINITY_DN76716_c0_g1_i1:52-1281(-)
MPGDVSLLMACSPIRENWKASEASRLFDVPTVSIVASTSLSNGSASTDAFDHYDRRLVLFAAEYEEHQSKVQEYKDAFVVHHDYLRKLEEKRHEVGRLQRYKTELEVQSIRDRLRELSMVSECQDLESQLQKYFADVTTSPEGARSDCMVRVVVAPKDVAIDSDMRQTRLEIEEIIQAHTKDIESFDVERLERLTQYDKKVGLMRAELQEELKSLEGERCRLASALTCHLELRADQLKMQRQHAVDVDALKKRNSELLQGLEAASAAASLGLCFEERSQTRVRDPHACAKGVREDAGDVQTMVHRINDFQNKCTKHRRQMHQALARLKADLSLLSKKCAVLETVTQDIRRRSSLAGRSEGGGGGVAPRSQAPRSQRSKSCVDSRRAGPKSGDAMIIRSRSAARGKINSR